MLTLIHGDDIVSSRKALDELKAKYEVHEKIVFDGTKIILSDIISASDSRSLFGAEKLIIIENLLAAASGKEKESILTFLKESKSTTEVILWEQKEISKPIIKKYLSRAKIVFCQLPQILFRFLDSIGEKPTSQTLSMLHSLTSQRDAEFILSMLFRQWRYLIVAKDLGEAGFMALPAWQAFKFIKQARYFNLPTLLSSYRGLLSCDQKIKMGATPYTLKELLDIFLVSLYYQN